jgi:ABC-2 type transport system ATP-binding protein
MSAAVSLRELTKSYRQVQAVRRVDVSIARGETVALLGPNGAGKSTTIDMLLGLTPPDTGEVELLGRSPREAVDAGLVGAMLQVGDLVRDLTPRELLSTVASLYPEPLRVKDVIQLVGIEGVADRRTQKLSGGESQRVRFALALIGDPQVLVLDEPTAGMDVMSRNAFWLAVRRYAAQGRTVLFATHYLEEAEEFADRVVLMARGDVVADGATSEVRARVGHKTIRATLPGTDVESLLLLPSVLGAENRGSAVRMSTSDSDETLRALLAEYPDVRDIEVTGAGLEEAFLELTEAVPA